MGGRKKQFGLYKGSPIEQLCSAAISTIQRVRAKYAQADNTIEKIHADAMLKGLEGIMTTLHENTLPYFENGRTDVNLLTLAFPMRHHIGLAATFQTREWVLYEAVIEMIPGLLKTAKKNATTPDQLQVELNKLLDEKQETLFTKARNIPSQFKLEETFAFIKKALVQQRLYANADSTKDREIEAKKLDLAMFDFGAPYGYSAVNSYHPAMYEFTIELTKQFMMLPRELSKLIPFINPVCASRDFTGGGIVAALMRAFSPRQANLQHQPNPNGEISYNFKLTLVPPPVHPDDVKDGEYDGAAYYSRYYNFALSAMLRQIFLFPQTCSPTDRDKVIAMHDEFIKFAENFYHTNKDENLVRSEQARSIFLGKFLRAKIDECEKVIRDVPSVLVDDKKTGLALIAALNAAQERELARRHHFEFYLSQRKAVERELLSHLLGEGPALSDHLQADKQAGLDISYAKSPVPDAYFDFSNPKSLTIVPFKSEYKAAIEQTLTELGFDERVGLALEERIKQATTAWIKQRLAEFKAISVSMQNEITSKFKKELAEITNKTLVNPNDVLAHIQQQQAGVDALIKTVSSLAQTARQNIVMSAEEKGLNSNALEDGLAQAQQAVETCIDQFVREANISLQTLHQSEKQLRDTQAKAEEEAAFQNSLRDQGPEKLRELMAAEALALQELELKTLALNNDVDAVAANLASIMTMLRQPYDDVLQKMARKDLALEQECQVVIDRAVALISTSCHASPADLDGCMAWVNSGIKTVTAELSEVQHVLSTASSHQALLQNRLLQEVTATLNAKKKKTLTFAEIRALASVQKYAGDQDGFAKILKLVGYSDVQVAEWLALEVQQKNPLKRNKRAREERLAELDGKIAATLQANTVKLDQNANEAGVPALLSKRELLRQLQTQLHVLLERKSDHHHARMQAFQLMEKGLRDLDAPVAAHEAEKQMLAGMVLNANKKRDAIKLYQLNIDLLEGLIPLREASAAFANISGHFTNDNHEVVYTALYNLCREIDQLKARVQTVEDELLVRMPVPPLMSGAKKLLQLATQAIERSIEEKLAVDLDDFGAVMQALQSLCNHPPTMSSELQPYDHIYALSKRSEALVEKFENLKAKVDVQTASCYLAVIERKDKQLQDLWSAFGNVLQAQFKKTFADYADEIEAERAKYLILNSSFNAKTPLQWLNAENLSQTLIEFRHLYHDAAVSEKKLAKIYRNMDSLGYVADDYPVPSVRSDMLALRHQLFKIELAAKWQELLSIYLEDRKIQYSRKDMFFSHDKAEREAYVQQELMSALATYVESHDSSSLLSTIQLGINKFYGKQFRLLLNNMMIELIDFERVHAPRHQALFNKSDILADLQAQADAAFSAIPNMGRNKGFKTSIQNLYTDTANLRAQAVLLSAEHPQDGAKLAILADDLQKDVCRYLVSGPTQVITAEMSFTQFRNVITARLHSQDDVLTRHRSVWPIAFNIIVGVFSVGLALLACLAVTKLAYGRATLFFNDTSALKRNIDRLENTVNDDVEFYRPQQPR